MDTFTLKEFGGVIEKAIGKRYNLDKIFNMENNDTSVRTSVFFVPGDVKLNETDYTSCGGVDIDCLDFSGKEITAEDPIYINTKLPVCFDKEEEITAELITTLQERAVTAIESNILQKAIQAIKAKATDKNGISISYPSDVVQSITAGIQTLLDNGSRAEDITLLITPAIRNILKFGSGQFMVPGGMADTSLNPVLSITDIESYFYDKLEIGHIETVEAKILNPVGHDFSTSDTVQFVVIDRAHTPLKDFCNVPAEVETITNDPRSIKPYTRLKAGRMLGYDLLDANLFCFGKCPNSTLNDKFHEHKPAVKAAAKSTTTKTEAK